MKTPEEKTFQYYYSGEWIDTTENHYLQMINNNHHGRIIKGGEIIEQTEGAPRSRKVFLDGGFDEDSYSNIYDPNWRGYKSNRK